MNDLDDPARELRRVVARLAALGPERVERTPSATVGDEPARSPAALVRAELQDLADLAADAEDRPRATVPRLASHALGDQLTVLVNDVLAVGRHDLTAEVAQRLTRLRRAL